MIEEKIHIGFAQMIKNRIDEPQENRDILTNLFELLHGKMLKEKKGE